MVAPGVYNVKESGLEYQHGQPEPTVTPEEFLDEFRQNFEMRILEQPSENHLVFEMLHVDTSFVNALRRILLAEVPTVAFEHVYMWNNTSIIHDEVLAHRIGLIPLTADARWLDEQEVGDSLTDRNTIVFRLAVTCSKKGEKKKGGGDDDEGGEGEEATVLDGQESSVLESVQEAATSGHQLHFPKDRPYTKHVYSRDLKWMPQGEQEEIFPEGVKPIHGDILVAKLRPGQSIELEAHAKRGIGKDHAKYSPVATASYRLFPQIELVHDVYDEVAEELVHVYEPGVFELIPTDKDDPAGTRVKAKLVNPYACTMSRNYMRHPQLEKSIRMSRVKDRFIFSVESVGTYKPAILVAEALRVLQAKCHKLANHIEESQEQNQE